MKRYRVESKGEGAYFRVDCYEDKLDHWKTICKIDAKEINGKCYYREFPLSNNKKIYY